MATRKDIQLAAKWKRVIRKAVARDLKVDWGYDNAGMIKMFKQDERDHTKAANLLREGKYQRAYNALWNMDTATRDLVPASVYNYLENKVYADAN